MPDEIHVYANQQINWEEVFHNPLIRYDSSVEASRNGSYRVECRLLGMIPLKTVKVSLAEEQEVYVGGSTVGIYMESDHLQPHKDTSPASLYAVWMDKNWKIRNS